jgi:GH24 family phage-related lysozyme (muramidase)/uncharacterized Zn-binding protein involved in type VI secretion
MDKLTIIINDLTLCHKASDGMARATLPDVCKTPTSGGPVPLPYSNTALSANLSKGSKTVEVDGGNMAAIKGSEFSSSTGDEAGSVGGIKSGVYAKEATWLSYSPDVKFEGKNVCRLTDKMLMNHGNTVCLAGEEQARKSAKDTKAKCDKVCPKKGPYKMSEDGKKFLKEKEGFRSQVYEDIAGHCTVGYGSLLHKGACVEADFTKYASGITEEQATELFEKELASFENTLNKNVKVDLNQNQFDALVSFAFNVGGGNFRSSTLLKKLNAGEYGKVKGQLNRWVNAGGKKSNGLVNRRKAEGELFEDKSCPAQACKCCNPQPERSKDR